MRNETKALSPHFVVFASRGVALIMVLWVIAILSVVVLEFSFGMRTEVNMTKNFKEEAILYALAEGGIQRAVAELIYQNDPFIQQKRKAMEGNLPSEKEVWTADGRPISLPFSQGKCEIRIIGEDGKININRVSESLLRRIIRNMGWEGEAQDRVVDSIMDWIDPNDLHRLNGAENDYYQSLPEPYFCKNGYLDSIEELLLIRGVTPELFYGKKRKEEAKSERIGLKDIFSVFAPGEQVNINHASPLVMRMALGIPPGVAELVVKGREEKPFENQQDLVRRVPELSAFITEIGRNIIYQSRTPYYTIESRATYLDSSSVRGIKAIVKIDRREKQGYKIIQWIDALW